MLAPIGTCGTVFEAVRSSTTSLVLQWRSKSNGSGKSSLAMASLWALTGSMDPRRAQDGKVSDVVNDESKVKSFFFSYDC